MCVVAAIYSTLGLARTLAGILRDNGLLEGCFVLGTLLIGIAILTQGLRKRPGGAEIGVALGVSAVYILALTRIAAPAERTHLIEYGVVAILIHEALRERASQGRHVPAAALIAMASASVLGVLDECIQAYLPDRIFDPRDILFNVLASAMAVSANVALAWARQRFQD